MTRKPRKQKDHLVSGRLLTHAYGQMGEIATAGGFFTYFIVMSVYGFDYSVIFFLLSVNASFPYVVEEGVGTFQQDFNANYIFEPTNLANFGNPYFPPANTTIFNGTSS